jgi:quercetin dioxygenase-like cupin family protein
MESDMNTSGGVKRKFIADDHIRAVFSGKWVAMIDNTGSTLAGIRGRAGAAGQTDDGEEIGVDLIEMQPGSGFELHTHSGQHILYVVEGEGAVVVDGVAHSIHAGDTIFVPAEYPHGVTTGEADRPLSLLSFGYPHTHIGAIDRMHLYHITAETDGTLESRARSRD